MDETRAAIPRIQVEISLRTIAAVLGVIAGLWLLWELSAVVVVVVLALILVGTLAPMVGWLEAHRIKRGFALAIVFVSCLAAAVVLVLITIPPLARDAADVVSHLPETQGRMADRMAATPLTAPMAESVREFKPASMASSVSVGSALAISALVFEILGLIGTAFVLAIYVIADGERMRGTVFSLVPRRFHVRLARVLLNLETIVGGYMRGQVITSLAIGAFTFALLSLLHVPNALALAAFAGFTDVIPFVGGLLATTPAVLSALTRGPAVAGGVLVAMILYQEFESRVLVPRVYGRSLRLPSAVVVVALLIGGKLGGIVGALLALPIAAAIRMLMEEMRVALPGEAKDDGALRARDERAEQIYARRTGERASADEAAEVALGIANEIRHADSDPVTAAETPITGGEQSAPH